MDILNFIDVLNKNKLFKVFSKDTLTNIFSNINYTISSYKKNDIIFMEDDICTCLSVILEGSVEIQKIDVSGKILKISTFKSGDVFGENLIFGDKTSYPMTVVSLNNAILLNISKSSLINLCQSNPEFLYEFLKIQSNKALALSNKIKQVTLKTIRQKICEFILNEYAKNNSLTIPLKISKKEWADKLGVQRPSLSRELIKLKDEEIIDYGKDFIMIKDLDALEYILT